MLPSSPKPPDPTLSPATEVSSRCWTVAGLVIALFALPLTVGIFTALRVPWTAANIVLRELIIFALAGALVFIIRRRELLGWESVGLQRVSAGKTALWVLITIPALALALLLAFGII